MDGREEEAKIPEISRDRVVGALKAFTAWGIGDPANLPHDNPQVEAVEAIVELWERQLQERLDMSTEEGDLEFALSRTTIYVDAGFDDPIYLEEVAYDWLAQDLYRAEEAGLTELAGRIRAKIEEIERKMGW